MKLLKMTSKKHILQKKCGILKNDLKHNYFDGKHVAIAHIIIFHMCDKISAKYTYMDTYVRIYAYNYNTYLTQTRKKF